MIDSASFERHPQTAKQARRFVIDRLRGHDSTLVDNVALMASELVTNSIQYSTGNLTLTLEVDEHTIRVAVTDVGPGRPTVGNPSPEDPNGRGLRIVATLADEWGATTGRDGANTVWFTLHVHPEQRRERSTEADVARRSGTTASPSGAGPQRASRRTPDREPPLPTARADGFPSGPAIATVRGVDQCPRRHSVAGRCRAAPVLVTH